MVITLCGSTRFEEQFHEWNERLTLAGHTVFSLSVFPSTKSEREWYSSDVKKSLDLAHKRKINHSDAIFVVYDESEYVGDSTKSEIEYARKNNLPIYSPTLLPPTE